MAKGTSASKFIKVPQILAETTEGTPVQDGTYANIGGVLSLSIRKDGDWQDISQLGKQDLLALIQGLKTFEVQVKIVAINTNFAKRFFNLADEVTPAGTSAETVTLVTSLYLDGVENYIICYGCRPKQIQYVREAGKADEFTCDIECMDISKPLLEAAAEAIIGASCVFDVAAAGAVISYLSGGADSVSWNAVGLKCKRISVSVNQNTTSDHSIGNEKPFGNQYHGRRATFDADVIWTNDDLEDDYDTKTSRTLIVVVKTATSNMTLTNAQITTHNKDNSSDDTMASVEKITGKCTSIQLT